MRSGLRGTIIGLWTIAALSVAATSAIAADDAAIAVGKAQYMKHCATCHGPSGTGTDGVASRLFTKPPANLTLLAKNNGGKFPMMEVIGIVKGDRPIAAHGTREMPVWGLTFSKREVPKGEDPDAVARGRIEALIEYLKTIQRK